MNDIYSEVMNFCKKRGLISDLKKSFAIPEADRFNKMGINKSGLALLDAVHCLYEKKRTDFFREEIKKDVKKGDIVVEAGIGTGILSFFAASRGAHVYGCEINPAIFKFANEVKSHLEKKGLIPEGSVEFFLHDATTFVPPKKIDVLISENIYTGMFFEYQVQITKHLSKFLKRNALVIPQTMSSDVTLCEIKTDRILKNKELIVPLSKTKIRVVAVNLSKPYQYDLINFKKVKILQPTWKSGIKINNSGKINGVLITSDIKMPSGMTIYPEDTTFLNNRIYITLKPIQVSRGDIIDFSLRYRYGHKVGQAKFALKKRGVLK